MAFFEGGFDRVREEEAIKGFDLEGLLRKMEEVTAEWHKKENRDESVRQIELPLIEQLAKTKVPTDKKDEVLRVVREFYGLADDTLAVQIAKNLEAKLKSKE